MAQYEEAHKEHINKYKMAHSIGVAEFMRENAEKYGLDPNAMYVAGLLHDIGYLEGRKNHEANGAVILNNIGITDEKVLFAVQNHGKNLYEVAKSEEEKYDGEISILYDIPEIVLMCEADMSVNARGYRVGFDKRLEDIGHRYGKDGIEYATASATVNYVKEALEEISHGEKGILAYVRSSDETERQQAAKHSIGLRVLVNDDSPIVRAEVARQGYGLDVLVNDEDSYVRMSVARYGRDEDLDILVNDENERVRYEVARQGRDKNLDALVNDGDWQVRSAVAWIGRRKDLDILVNDTNIQVKEIAQKKMTELNKQKPYVERD